MKAIKYIFQLFRKLFEFSRILHLTSAYQPNKLYIIWDIMDNEYTCASLYILEHIRNMCHMHTIVVKLWWLLCMADSTLNSILSLKILHSLHMHCYIYLKCYNRISVEIIWPSLALTHVLSLYPKWLLSISLKLEIWLNFFFFVIANSIVVYSFYFVNRIEMLNIENWHIL